MGMRHGKEGKGPTASTADYAILAATSVTIAASNGYRQKVEFWVTGATAAVVAYNAVATSTLNSLSFAAGASYLENVYTGAITAAIPSAAASTSIRVREISG